MKTLETKSISTLTDFYNSMRALHEIRVRIVSTIKRGDSIEMGNLIALEEIKLQLEDIQKENGTYILKTEKGRAISLELDYELSELKKDDVFIKHGYKALKEYLTTIHPNYIDEANTAFNFLKKDNYKHFITDRDGTISNYCGRYQSSIQPIYNALCLSEFSRTIKGKSIILTSAPLFDIGLADISILPEGEYILAGSKGREVLVDGEKHVYPIDKEKQEKLNELNKAIEKLLEKEDYSVFKYIGSGLQHKFGQTTLARQDKNNSIPEEKSLSLKNKIKKIIKNLDSEANFFSLEDTGKDLEIMLKIKSNNDNLEEFDKGHGLKFIMNQLGENIQNESILVCGDTASDVPLITAAQELGGTVTSIFVTEDEDLKKSVRSVCKNSFFVSSPDVLLYILFKYTKKEQTWNPLSLFLSLIN